MAIAELEVKNHVAYVTLNRPGAMNALNPELRFALSEVWDRVEQEDDI